MTDRCVLRFAPIATPPLGTLGVICAGVYWLRVPIPIPLKTINLWVLGDQDGVTLIDTGMNHDDCRSVWNAVAAEIASIGPVRDIVCTHWHPDHFGLADFLQSRYNVPVWLSAADWDAVQEFWNTPGSDWAKRNRAFYARHGFSPPAAFDDVLSLEVYRLGIGGLPSTLKPIAGDHRLTSGGHEWRAILTQGHTQGHICFYSATLGLLISGDQLLPKISTNVSVSLMRNGDDPLSQFLESLEILGRLPRETIVLPAHGMPFFDPLRRAEDLRAHHALKLELARSAASTPISAVDATKLLFMGAQDGMNMILAMGETLAHLRRLTTTGALSEMVGADGVHRFVNRHDPDIRTDHGGDHVISSLHQLSQ